MRSLYHSPCHLNSASLHFGVPASPYTRSACQMHKCKHSHLISIAHAWFMYLQNIIQKVLSNHFSILWSSPRPISTSQLHALLHFHPKPINLVVFKGSYSYDGISYLEGGFTLRCLQRLSLPDLATLL